MGTVLFGFRDSDSFELNPNDPNNVMIAPNLSGFNRVVISLPNELLIDDILNDLVNKQFILGIEEHELVENNHYIIKRKNELETKELINYLNSKYGYISHKGYVKPSRNIVIK